MPSKAPGDLPHPPDGGQQLRLRGIRGDGRLAPQFAERSWVYRFAKHDCCEPLMQHEAKVLDLVRTHFDTPVPSLEPIGDDCSSKVWPT